MLKVFTEQICGISCELIQNRCIQCCIYIVFTINVSSQYQRIPQHNGTLREAPTFRFPESPTQKINDFLFHASSTAATTTNVDGAYHSIKISFCPENFSQSSKQATSQGEEHSMHVLRFQFNLHTDSHIGAKNCSPPVPPW